MGLGRVREPDWAKSTSWGCGRRTAAGKGLWAGSLGGKTGRLTPPTHPAPDYSTVPGLPWAWVKPGPSLCPGPYLPRLPQPTPQQWVAYNNRNVFSPSSGGQQSTKCAQDHTPCGRSKGNPPSASPFGLWWLLAFLSRQQDHSDLCHRSHTTASSALSLRRKHVIELRAHPDNPG